MVAYHDDEWGVPCHDDRALFERLVLEGFQAGLSWTTVLHKREAFREAFAGFDPEAVAGFGEADVARLLGDARIVRNRLKVAAAIANARAFLAVAVAERSFDRYLWGFVGGAPVERTAAPGWDEIPATTPVSLALSRDLKRRGFSFVGPTICYALMQSAGLVNDHVVGCFLARPLRPGQAEESPWPAIERTESGDERRKAAGPRRTQTTARRPSARRGGGDSG